MGKAEITIFIILINAILLIFIIGIIIFIFQYRKRKILHQKEKGIMEEKHRIELLNTQLEIQQQTMQFIGREIHDSVTQKLTLASIYTQHLEFENQYPGLLEKLKGISLNRGQGIAGTVAETGESILVGDVSTDPRHTRVR